MPCATNYTLNSSNDVCVGTAYNVVDTIPICGKYGKLTSNITCYNSYGMLKHDAYCTVETNSYLRKGKAPYTMADDICYRNNCRYKFYLDTTTCKCIPNSSASYNVTKSSLQYSCPSGKTVSADNTKCL